MSTILVCIDCLKRLKLEWKHRAGGSFVPQSCQLCGEERHLAEYVEPVDVLLNRVRELEKLINHPHNDEWFEGVKIEAAHQIERWGTQHDEGKNPEDWFWLVGYLAGKCLRSCIQGDTDKAKHHTISTAAVLLNWHRRLSGTQTAMRPGIAEPK